MKEYVILCQSDIRKGEFCPSQWPSKSNVEELVDFAKNHIKDTRFRIAQKVKGSDGEVRYIPVTV